MLYEFQCLKCEGMHADYYPITEAPPIGFMSGKKCICGGKLKRVASLPQLRPEFFGITMENASERPVHFSTKTAIERFRRDEFIRSTNGTKLEGKEGKLQYSDKDFNMNLVKKQKEKEAKRKNALKDGLVKAEFRSKKRGG